MAETRDWVGAHGTPDLADMTRRLAAAHERLAGVATVTPVVHARQLDERTGATVFLKCEQQQRVGAFKFRGAWNVLAAMDPERRREIARKGGARVPSEKRSFAKDRDLAANAGRKGGSSSRGGGRLGARDL